MAREYKNQKIDRTDLFNRTSKQQNNMIIIVDNIENKAYHYKVWYKKMNSLLGTKFDTTPTFENSLSIGQKIHIDSDNPTLPTGMTIPKSSTLTVDELRTFTLEILDISQIGNEKSIKVGIRSTESKDY